MRNIIIIVGLLIILIAAFFLTQRINNGTSPFEIFRLNIGGQAKATINKQSFNLLVAKTDAEKQIGLSEKKSLPQNQGMLFQFDSAGYHSFWMRNMKFPIDIIFIREGKIITIHKSVKPPTENETLSLYKPEQPADAVVEINAGLSEKYGFKQGDNVEIKI